MTLQPGQVLNQRYRIDTQIGQGSLGAVYVGWDFNLNTAIVVKEQRDVSPDATRKFTRQARALANLRHPGLPYVIDHFSLPDQGQYLVMEFINGQDLQAVLVQSGQGIPEGQAIPWLFQVCDALTYLHTQPTPLFHRDVKPANIRVTPQGKVVLVDYGIGLASDPDYAATHVGGRAYDATAMVMGNPYTAPEQFAGYSDARSDLYALAASLYAVLTARPPVDSRARQAGQPLPSLRQLNPAISPLVESAILQAMHLDPEQRFQTVKAFQAALAGYQRAEPALVVKPAARPPVAATMKAPDWPASPNYPLRGAPGAAGGATTFDAPVSYPTLADDRYGPAAPAAPKRTGRVMGLAAGLLLLACLLFGLVGGGAYLLWNFPASTPMDAAQAVAATLTAEATRRALVAQPTLATPPATAAPDATFTLPPVLPLDPTFTPTFTPSLTPTSTATETATQTATPTEKAQWQPCPGTYPSRLYVGDTAMVNLDPPLPNRVRSEASTSSTILGFIQPGENVQVIGGPVCSNEWIWWQVSSLTTGLTGWTAEGDRQGYWLAPVR